MPWPGFRDQHSPWDRPSAEAFQVAQVMRSSGEKRKSPMPEFMTRSSHQVFGAYLRRSVDFLIC